MQPDSDAGPHGPRRRRRVENAHGALRTADTERPEALLQGDNGIDNMEREIEHRCMTCCCASSRWRATCAISTALKMVTDIERMGDQASDIAEITLHLHPDGARAVGVLDDLYEMGECALNMVKDAIAAYVQVDLSAAAQVIARDDDCDAMFSRISKRNCGLHRRPPRRCRDGAGLIYDR